MGDPLPQFRFGTENIRQSLRTIACLGEVLCVLCLLSGCSTSAPKVGLIYNRAAQYENGDRNPIIVIPGITGSKLTLNDHIVWGAFEGGHSDSATAEGARALALPMRKGVSLAQLRDDTQAGGVLDHLEVSVLGLSIRLRAYVGLLSTLGIGGFRDANLGLSGAMDYGDSHFTCFQFGYDWRRDNVENARRLHQFILEKKKYIRMERTKRFGRDADEEIKFDIVAHSMGGLVARYYLRYGPNEPPPLDAKIKIPWSGCGNVERLIMVGTPNAGSAEAVITLVNGASFAPLLPKWAPAIVGTFPSVYQMLPRSRHHPLVDKEHPERTVGDILDPNLWLSHGWGLAAPIRSGSCDGCCRTSLTPHGATLSPSTTSASVSKGRASFSMPWTRPAVRRRAPSCSCLPGTPSTHRTGCRWTPPMAAWLFTKPRPGMASWPVTAS